MEGKGTAIIQTTAALAATKEAVPVTWTLPSTTVANVFSTPFMKPCVLKDNLEVYYCSKSLGKCDSLPADGRCTSNTTGINACRR